MSTSDNNPSIIPPIAEKFRGVMLFGPPGAGKGTVGRVLSIAGSMVHVSSGDIFRSLSPASPAGRLTQQYIQKGELVPDEVTIEVWHYYVNGLVATNRFFPDKQFILMDGLPRTVEQARLIERYVDVQHAIVLDMEDTGELITRLKRRALIEGRADDAKDEVLQKRLDVYQTQTAQVLSHYPAELVSTFNADQPPLHVLRDVLAKLADTLTSQTRPLAPQS